MKQLKHPATIVAMLAMFVALSGGALASGLISGSQIKNHSIAEKKLTKNAIKALGPHGSSAVVATRSFAGPVATVIPPQALPYTFSWVFEGPTVSLTIASTQHLTGTAAAVLGSTSGTAFDFGLCYQKTSGGEVRNFVGTEYLTAEATHLRLPYTASASVVPGTGSWKVGFCVVNEGPSSLNDNDFVNGWVQAMN